MQWIRSILGVRIMGVTLRVSGTHYNIGYLRDQCVGNSSHCNEG